MELHTVLDAPCLYGCGLWRNCEPRERRLNFSGADWEYTELRFMLSEGGRDWTTTSLLQEDMLKASPLWDALGIQAGKSSTEIKRLAKSILWQNRGNRVEDGGRELIPKTLLSLVRACS